MIFDTYIIQNEIRDVLKNLRSQQIIQHKNPMNFTILAMDPNIKVSNPNIHEFIWTIANFPGPTFLNSGIQNIHRLLAINIEFPYTTDNNIINYYMTYDYDDDDNKDNLNVFNENISFEKYLEKCDNDQEKAMTEAIVDLIQKDYDDFSDFNPDFVAVRILFK